LGRRAVLALFATITAIMEATGYGYDERQYRSPGFNLPVGRNQRLEPGRPTGLRQYGLPGLRR
jgi:aminopeptidase-like protein